MVMLIIYLRDLLDGSGWTNVLIQAGIATPGTADSFLMGAHVKRTRHAHQITSSALSIMLRTAYDAYCLDTSEPLPFDDWCVKQVEASPQFHCRGPERRRSPECRRLAVHVKG